MNNLFSAHWNGPTRRASPRNIDCSRPSGFGRLLAAVVIIGIAVSLLDHVAAGKDAAAPFELPFLPLEKTHPNIARWMRTIEAIPGYDRTYPPHWRG